MPVDRNIEDKSNKVAVDVEVDNKKGTVDFNSLKSGGFIKQRQKDLFTLRLRCPGGRVPLERLQKALEVAKRYGGDYVHLSFRQSIEIPYVNYKNFGAIQKELEKVGQKIASCGPRVRVPTACSGCEYNPNGITDTQKMTKLVDEQFFARQLTHKFKISFSGCPIDCARTNEMDLAFQGAALPSWDEEPCIGCRICGKACLEGAIENDAETGKPVYHRDKCLYCGDCIRACPTESWKRGKVGWVARVGGKHGRHPFCGSRIAEFLPDNKVPEVIQFVLDWYKEKGAGKGRIRIANYLQEPKLWKDFVKGVASVVGKCAVKDPRPPFPVEIHF